MGKGASRQESDDISQQLVTMTSWVVVQCPTKKEQLHAELLVGSILLTFTPRLKDH